MAKLYVVGLLLASSIAINLQQRVHQTSAAEASAATQEDASYKSDALDELLENSLFKRKHAPAPVTEESIVDEALKAKVDPNDFNCGSSPDKTPAAAPQLVPKDQAPDETVSYSNMQQARDN